MACDFVCFRKVIPIYITEEDSYEKDVLFYVQLGEPRMLGGRILSFYNTITLSLVPLNIFNTSLF